MHFNSRQYYNVREDLYLRVRKYNTIYIILRQFLCFISQRATFKRIVPSFSAFLSKLTGKKICGIGEIILQGQFTVIVSLRKQITKHIEWHR